MTGCPRRSPRESSRGWAHSTSLRSVMPTAWSCAPRNSRKERGNTRSTSRAKRSRRCTLPSAPTSAGRPAESDRRAVSGNPRRVATDVDLVLELARALPQVTVTLVGLDALATRARARLNSTRNIVVLGPRPYEEIPAYLQHADALIVPHLVITSRRAWTPSSSTNAWLPEPRLWQRRSRGSAQSNPESRSPPPTSLRTRCVRLWAGSCTGRGPHRFRPGMTGWTSFSPLSDTRSSGTLQPRRPPPPRCVFTCRGSVWAGGPTRESPRSKRSLSPTVRVHEVVDNPAEADVVLFVQCHMVDWRLAAIRGHPTARAHGTK